MSDSIYRPITTMPAGAAKEFADVDLLIAVRFETDEQGCPTDKPIVTVMANPALKTSVTNLSGLPAIAKNNGVEYKLLPARDEVLQFITPDAVNRFCLNRPIWYWMGMSFDKL